MSLKTQTSNHHGLGAYRFSRFSSLHSLQRAIVNLIVVIKEFKRRKNKSQEEIESISSSKNTKLMRKPTAKELQEAMTVIIRAVQSESLSEELKSDRRISESKKPETVPKSLNLYRLDPFVDNNGVLRVGGRLRRATLEFGEKHPVLIPKKNHVADLITRHYHRQVHHQGRQITHGAIRQAGYWLIGGHNTVSILRCDRGTNVIGGKSELGDALRETDQRQVKGYVNNHGCEWIFNPPHASHFGGAWERQIVTIRRVLEAMFAELGSH